MSFRLKLLLSLSLLVTLSCVVAGGILYYQARNTLFRELQSKVLSIAATTAALVDGELHKKVCRSGDEETAAYRKLAQILREARDANRREDVDVAFIYTLYFDSENRREIRFGVDAEEDPAEKSNLGEIYEGKPGAPLYLAARQVDSEFSVDRWGTWLSASAPVLDDSGAAVALLGVDVRSEEVLSHLARIRWSLYGAVGLSLMLAIAISYGLSQRVSRPLLSVRSTLEQIGEGNLSARLHLKTRDEFGEVAEAINRMAGGLEERETLKDAFARYVSQNVMDEIIGSGKLQSLQGRRKKVTVLFSDIRNFTSLAEGHSPEQVVGLLNEYFEAMIDIIFQHQGTLDKFIGDGLMVLFGAPLDDEEQEVHAVETAIRMQQKLQSLARKWNADLDATIRVGIGIHSGQAIVGNIGSSKRMEYTAIGDTVNIASRLESATKELQMPVLISDSTRQALGDRFHAQPMGSIQVKGRHAPIEVFALSCLDEPISDFAQAPYQIDSASSRSWKGKAL